MPAHCSQMHVGKRRLSDGTVTTAIDLKGNADVDQLAKGMASRHTAPVEQWLATDRGKVFDLLVDPPAAVTAEAKAAVRRWRWKNVARQIPHLVPDIPDITVGGPDDAGFDDSGSSDLHLDFANVLAKVLKPGYRSKAFEGLEPRHRSSLISAVSGGQWPQARLYSTRRWTDDKRCQLCLGCDGTLEHRQECPATRPHEGWQSPTKRVQDFVQALHPSRRTLLQTRGLLSLRVRATPPPERDTFEWVVYDPNGIDANARWYIDGSMFDGKYGHAFLRTGFAIVVVSQSNDLLAYGFGIPPPWVQDAAGAEAWAFATTLSSCPDIPPTTTDCRNLLLTLCKGPAAATDAKSPLARTWAMAFNALECDYCSPEQIHRLEWMPAHKSAAAIGVVRNSNGQRMTAVDWRANRLVDALAKHAAQQHRVQGAVTKKLDVAAEAVEFYAARLGAITFAANHYKVATVLPDGTTTWNTRRDSTAIRPQPKRGAEKRKAQQQAEVSQDGAQGAGACGTNFLEGPRRVRPRNTAAHNRERQQDLECANEARFRQHWLASRNTLRPTECGDAQRRMAAFRERVAAKLAASSRDTG